MLQNRVCLIIGELHSGEGVHHSLSIQMYQISFSVYPTSLGPYREFLSTTPFSNYTEFRFPFTMRGRKQPMRLPACSLLIISTLRQLGAAPSLKRSVFRIAWIDGIGETAHLQAPQPLSTHLPCCPHVPPYRSRNVALLLQHGAPAAVLETRFVAKPPSFPPAS